MLKNKAGILILTLWSVSFLSLLLVILGYGIRQKISLVKRIQERPDYYLLAEPDIIKRIASIKDLFHKEQITLNDLNPNNFQPIISPQQNLIVEYYISDEQAKLNINKVKPEILENLFLLLGLEEKKSKELASSIIDWRDSDSELSIPLGSAEDNFYRWQDFPYEAKDYDFEVLEELLLVKDMDQETFTKIKEYLTIYGDGRININTTDPLILRALGIEKDLVDIIIEYRNGKDKLPFSSDDNFFEGNIAILEKITSFKEIQPHQIERLSLIIEKYLTTNSSIFNISSVCKDKLHRKIAEVKAIVDREGKIISFRRD
ncbi:MAG: general secretion pathway protein GspK [Candidatus Omnitrophica bacterium]|nr:general secretion pathway protein GspK [Candidatus Omnitrophota bacterium]